MDAGEAGIIWDDNDYDSSEETSVDSPTAAQVLAGETTRGQKLSEEDWAGHYEEQLLDMYYELKRCNEQGGWALFEKLTYPLFCEFAYKYSSGYK